MTDNFIRPLAPSDKAAWLKLWQAYLVFYEQTLDDAVTDGLFERLLGPDHHKAFVAEQNGVLTGFVHFLFHDSTWSLDQTCYLEDLYVGETVRGSGTGRKLIEAVYRAAEDEPGASGKVYWHTNQSNHRARQLYDRIGVLSDFVRYNRP